MPHPHLCRIFLAKGWQLCFRDLSHILCLCFTVHCNHNDQRYSKVLNLKRFLLLLTFSGHTRKLVTAEWLPADQEGQRRAQKILLAV